MHLLNKIEVPRIVEVKIQALMSKLSRKQEKLGIFSNILVKKLNVHYHR